MFRRQKKPVVAPVGATAARCQEQPAAASTSDDVVSNPGNQYGEGRLVIVMKVNIIIAIK